MFLARLFMVASAMLVGVVPRAGATAPGNPELVTLVERVLATHPSAGAARAEVDAARSELSASRWARFPAVSVESFADRRNGGDVSAAISVEQPLWTGGRISASIRQSSGRLDAAMASMDEVCLDLAQRAVQAYIDVQRLHRRARILEDSLVEHRKLVDSMRRRVDQEISPASDLELAQSRTRQTEIDALQTEAEAEIAQLRLRELTGDDSLRIAGVLDYREEQNAATPAELLRAALDFDPSARRIAAQAKIAAAEVSLRKSALMPQLGVRYQHYLGSDSDLDDELGLVFRIQADGGLSRMSAIKAAKQREQAASLAIDAASRERQQIVLAALTENVTARRRAQAGRDATLAAKSVTDSFLRQFAAGRRTWPEVLNSVRETATAELTQIDAEAGAVTSYVRLLLLSGQWRPDEVQSSEKNR
ncbi:TolC family protein [Peristeroidobacter soli]|uniref:TolC family protein n=1 Tax=Peristeroidobacter soli TaxID=2497877 RepID=UPI00101D85FB|nr:TolC family protein [Peristeroidobacter soli]